MPLKAVLFIVQLSKEAVSDVNHQVTEGKEEITLDVLLFDVFRSLKALKTEI